MDEKMNKNQVQELSEEDMRKLEMLKNIPPQVLEYLIEKDKKEREEAERAKRNEYLAHLRFYIPELEDFPDMDLDELENLVHTLQRAQLRENRKKAVKPPDAKKAISFRESLKSKGVMIGVATAIATVVLLLVRLTLLG